MHAISRCVFVFRIAWRKPAPSRTGIMKSVITRSGRGLASVCRPHDMVALVVGAISNNLGKIRMIWRKAPPAGVVVSKIVSSARKIEISELERSPAHTVGSSFDAGNDAFDAIPARGAVVEFF
jgi:hypothetical protein